MNDSLISVCAVPGMGQGVVARTAIPKDTVVARWDGPFYEAEANSKLPGEAPLHVADHAIQCAPRRWRDSEGAARLFNHSCEPNCGIRGLYEIVTMRDIREGEALTWDYEMTENSDWRMECRCGTPSCRGLIRAYRYMPQETRDRYAGYISEWLTN